MSGAGVPTVTPRRRQRSAVPKGELEEEVDRQHQEATAEPEPEPQSLPEAVAEPAAAPKQQKKKLTDEEKQERRDVRQQQLTEDIGAHNLLEQQGAEARDALEHKETEARAPRLEQQERQRKQDELEVLRRNQQTREYGRDKEEVKLRPMRVDSSVDPSAIIAAAQEHAAAAAAGSPMSSTPPLPQRSSSEGDLRSPLKRRRNEAKADLKPAKMVKQQQAGEAQVIGGPAPAFEAVPVAQRESKEEQANRERLAKQASAELAAFKVIDLATCQERLLRLENQIADQQQTIGGLQHIKRERATLSRECTEETKQKLAAQEHARELKKKLDMAEGQVIDFKALLNMNKGEPRTAREEEKIAEYKSGVPMLKARIETLEAEVGALTGTTNDLNQTNSRLSAELQTARQLLDKAEAKAEELAEQKKVLDGQGKDNRELQTLMNGKINEAQAQAQAAQKANAELQAQLNKAQSDHKAAVAAEVQCTENAKREIEKRIDALKQRDQEIAKLKAKIEAFDEKALEGARAEINRQKADIQRLQGGVNAAEDLHAACAADLKQLETEWEAKRTQWDLLLKEGHEESNKRQQQIDVLRATADEYETKLAVSDAALRGAFVEIERLQAALKAAEEGKQKPGDEKANAQITELERQLESEKKVTQSKIDQIVGLTSELSRYQRTLDLEKQTSTARSEELNKTVKLLSECQNALNTKVGLESKGVETKAFNLALQNCETRLNAETERANTAERRALELTGQLEICRKRLEELSAELGVEKKQSGEKVEELRQTELVSTANVLGMKDQIAARSRELLNCQQTLARGEQQFNERGVELQRCSDAVVAANATIERLQGEIKALREETAQLRAAFGIAGVQVNLSETKRSPVGGQPQPGASVAMDESKEHKSATDSKSLYGYMKSLLLGLYGNTDNVVNFFKLLDRARQADTDMLQQMKLRLQCLPYTAILAQTLDMRMLVPSDAGRIQQATKLDLFLNARVAFDPENQSQIFRPSQDMLCMAYGTELSLRHPSPAGDPIRLQLSYKDGAANAQSMELDMKFMNINGKVVSSIVAMCNDTEISNSIIEFLIDHDIYHGTVALSDQLLGMILAGSQQQRAFVNELVWVWDSVLTSSRPPEIGNNPANDTCWQAICGFILIRALRRANSGPAYAAGARLMRRQLDLHAGVDPDTLELFWWHHSDTSRHGPFEGLFLGGNRVWKESSTAERAEIKAFLTTVKQWIYVSAESFMTLLLAYAKNNTSMATLLFYLAGLFFDAEDQMLTIHKLLAEPSGAGCLVLYMLVTELGTVRSQQRIAGVTRPSPWTALSSNVERVNRIQRWAQTPLYLKLKPVFEDHAMPLVQWDEFDF